jgi:hypothetical protein
VSRITDAELRPYGYLPGRLPVWCAGCGRTDHPGIGKGAFKCRPCAAFDFRNVERDCKHYGLICGD